MKALTLILSVASVIAASLCGACAGNLAPLPTGQTLSSEAAMAQVHAGSSRKAEVESTLGHAIVIPFDSGYEVWVYRWPGPESTIRSATELVLLFDRSGLLTKARLRPGYAERDQ